ncbi:MAG: DUF1801 domain-containing protein [Tepidisphaera sp.]|nr:DUF1801 domain-containing protein [Tepidisphaera sp.]
MPASSVKEYLAALPADRRNAIQAVREVVLANLDEDYEEGIQYNMIGYYVPHSVFPPGYHCDPKQPLPFASLASQKNHMALYLMCIYGHDELRAWFENAWAKTGKKLDMGKACLRFKKIDDLALDVIGEAIRRVPAAKYIAHYNDLLNTPRVNGKPVKKAATSAAKKIRKKATKKTAKKAGKKASHKKAARR